MDPFENNPMYALVVHDGPDTSKLSVLRIALGVSIAEVSNFRKRMPGVVRRGIQSELLPLLEQFRRHGVHAELRPSSEFPDAEDILNNAGAGGSISIPLFDADFVALDQWPLKWRWTDPLHGAIPANDLQKIRPLCPAKARLAWDTLFSLVDIKAGRPTLAAARFQTIDSADASADSDIVRAWLQSHLPSNVDHVIVSWQPGEAALTTAEVFCRHWNSFCYPGSDDVTVWSVNDDWAAVYWHEEQFSVGVRRKNPGPADGGIPPGHIGVPNTYDAQSILGALGVPPLEKVEPINTEAAQVLFKPSFHPEMCLTVTLDDRRPQITLVTLQTNLWYWWQYKIDRDRGVISHRETPMNPPLRWEETATIPPARLEKFRFELNASSPASLVDTRSITIDGMGIDGHYRTAEGKASAFRHHMDVRYPQHTAFIMALYKLGIELLHDERSIRVLESIHGYLHLGLPLKIFFGPPQTVRIFGSLTSSHEPELRAALSLVSDKDPVLMDLSNFDGMGTILYPVFRKFLQRTGRTVWCARSHGRQQLEAIGVPAAWIADTRDAALAALAVRP